MINLVLSVFPAPDSPLMTTHWFSLILAVVITFMMIVDKINKTRT